MDTIAFLLLGLSICAVWLPAGIPMGASRRLPPWSPCFMAAVASGVMAGVLNGQAVLALVVLVGMAWMSRRTPSRAGRAAWSAAAVLLALALAFHLVPGFKNLLVAQGLQVSERSAPMSLYANFDKGAMGLVLLAFFSRRAVSRADWRGVARWGLGGAVVTAGVVIGAACATGHVAFDPKMPAIAPQFLAINLLFVCVAEEAFFRGMVQERLTVLVAGRASLGWVPVAASASLFGLAHAPGGMALALLAAVAGLGYSLVYAKTRSIEASVLTHFAVNAVHFIGFTYPYLSGAR